MNSADILLCVFIALCGVYGIAAERVFPIALSVILLFAYALGSIILM
jgi:hypothetical protein